MEIVAQPGNKWLVRILVGSAFLALVALFWSAKINLHNGVIADTRSRAYVDIIQIQTAYLSYYTEYSVYPESVDNAQLMKSLQGGDKRRIVFISLKPSNFNAKGEFIDRWGTPYRMTRDADLKLTIRSAGTDKVFGTADDLGGDIPAQ